MVAPAAYQKGPEIPFLYLQGRRAVSVFRHAAKFCHRHRHMVQVSAKATNGTHGDSRDVAGLQQRCCPGPCTRKGSHHIQLHALTCTKASQEKCSIHRMHPLW